MDKVYDYGDDDDDDDDEEDDDDDDDDDQRNKTELPVIQLLIFKADVSNSLPDKKRSQLELAVLLRWRRWRQLALVGVVMACAAGVVEALTTSAEVWLLEPPVNVETGSGSWQSM